MVLEGRLHMRPFQFHLKEHWRYPQSLDSILPWTDAICAHLDWWQNPANVMKGSDFHPKDHSIQLFTDVSNEGLGAHLDQSSTKGLWSDQEKRLHINLLELKAVSLALRNFKDQCQNQTVLVATDNSTVVAYINKQGGTHSVEMCALLWKIMTWCHRYHITLKTRHIPGCLNAMVNLLSRMVTASTGVQTDLPEVVHPSCRPVCHSSEPQTRSVRVSNSRPKGLVHRCTEHKLDLSHCLCLLSIGSPSQSDPKNQAMSLPNHSNSPHFSSPSVKQISDFFLYLYQDLNRRPSTIDGYRTATVDTLGPMAHHIAHNADLHRLLSSFHWDRPKSSRNLFEWNLSVVLSELTKAPFEPMKDTDLKHLTLKTAFLLALAFGKCRSEIHAWVANKVSNLGQLEKVPFPSSDFIAKNQLAKRRFSKCVSGDYSCFDYHCR